MIGYVNKKNPEKTKKSLARFLLGFGWLYHKDPTGQFGGDNPQKRGKSIFLV